MYIFIKHILGLVINNQRLQHYLFQNNIKINFKWSTIIKTTYICENKLPYQILKFRATRFELIFKFYYLH